ncbi:olfactory receptor 4B13-like [Pseudorasbora parva]|uniref:olfactory receptor 4B13-like n=1 Tax=Pseudorasbora parva TaxID=51549 RepID=UPI00351E9E73
MGNLSHFTTIILAGYIDIGNIKYLCFIVLILLFVAIIIANQLIIGIICKDKSLHEPMYVFLCSLSVNELYGSIALFPSILSNMLWTKIPEVSLKLCHAQIFVLYTYGSVEFCNLAIMSYDRYVAICYPLQYQRIMSPARTVTLIALGWSISIIKFSITLSVNVQLKLCGNVLDKVWCDNYMLVKLACLDTTANNISGIIGTTVTIVAPLALILFSYTKILIVCLFTREKTKKALSTCTPHLVSLLNFSVGCSFEIIQSRFDKVPMPPVLRVILSIYFLMCAPLINPIMYGMKLSKIRLICPGLVTGLSFMTHKLPRNADPGKTAPRQGILHSRAPECGSRHPVEAGAEPQGVKTPHRGGEAPLEENTHCNLWFSLTPPAPLGLDAMLTASEVLEFLQKRFSAGLAPSTLKVYVAAIAAYHTQFSPLALAHSTRNMAASQSLLAGASLQNVCNAARWSLPHTFVRFFVSILIPKVVMRHEFP